MEKTDSFKSIQELLESVDSNVMDFVTISKGRITIDADKMKEKLMEADVSEPDAKELVLSFHEWITGQLSALVPSN